MAAVRQYVEAFNEGDAEAMAGTCADPMQILRRRRACSMSSALRLRRTGNAIFVPVELSMNPSWSRPGEFQPGKST